MYSFKRYPQSLVGEETSQYSDLTVAAGSHQEGNLTIEIEETSKGIQGNICHVCYGSDFSKKGGLANHYTPYKGKTRCFAKRNDS